MKILAIADRPPSTPILETLANEQIDVIVTLGDLEMHQIRALQEVSDIPKLGIYGNHCSGMYMDSLGIQNMHLATTNINGVTFGGFEGCVKYKESSAKMYTQEEASNLLNSFSRVDIMLTHAPPFGINDEPEDPTHAGFKGLRTYLEKQKPAHLFHGHTYPPESECVTKYLNTKIHYITGSNIITI
jgi:Icc-related predicted phosphoesterase